MVQEADPKHLPASAQQAIRAAQERVQRAEAAHDVEATIGSAKELIETVAKAVIDALGGSYGSNIPMGKLAKQAIAAVSARPIALQGRPSLRKLAGSLVAAAQAVAELRNTDGTGHGRATPTNLDLSHAQFVRTAAIGWCQWVLAAAERALEDRVSLADALEHIGGQVFSSGQLRKYLDERHLYDLGAVEQRQLGLAVARRWTMNGTFMPLKDVIEPLIQGQYEPPAPFCEGLVEGLMLDSNGFVRTRSDDVRRAVAIAERLPGTRRETLYRGLAERVGEAQPSAEFTGAVRPPTVAVLRSLASARAGEPAGSALASIAARIEAFAEDGA